MYNKQRVASDWKRGDWIAVTNYHPPMCEKNGENDGFADSVGCVSRMYENSNAYLRHHSCETALNNLIESWRKARDGKFVVNILSTEMSRAFDSFHPPLLLSKLKPRKYKGVCVCVWGGGGGGGGGVGVGRGGREVIFISSVSNGHEVNKMHCT